MAIQFACPYCDKVSSVPDAFAGKQGKCPSCQKVIEVPDPAAGEATEAAGSAIGGGSAPAETARADVGTGTGTLAGAGTGTGAGAGMQECRFCGETIKKVAKKCRYCGEFLDRDLRAQRRHGQPGRERLASPWIRLGAAMLDGFLYFPAYGLFVAGVVVTDGFNKNEPAGAALIGLGLLLLFGLIGYQWYLVATRGASLAKGWLNIKIVKETGRDIDGFVDGVILRIWVIGFVANVLGQIIPGVGLIGLIDVLMIFSERRQCLHDRIAKTIVIEVPKTRGRR